jgi:hypothetical protein
MGPHNDSLKSNTKSVAIFLYINLINCSFGFFIFVYSKRLDCIKNGDLLYYKLYDIQFDDIE